jgi:hypothetical protein
MRFTIVEAKRYDATPKYWDSKEAISFIRKNCKPFLKSVGYKNHKMFRGTDGGDAAEMFIGTPRKKRLPSDMDRGDQKLFDKAFYKVFGWHPRSEGLFVTGNYSSANRYGPIYQIFPIGNFKFIYSKDVEDLYEEYNDDFSGYKKEIDDDRPAFIKKHYTDQYLKQGIKAGVEITLLCEKYLAIWADNSDWQWKGSWPRKYKQIMAGVFKK